MITPQDTNQSHQNLYHDFTDAYTNLYQMSRELYPAARKFVEKTEPEINRYMSKMAAPGTHKTNDIPYHDISKYMSRFDDFTIAANRVFGEISTAINRSEQLINRKLEIQKNDIKMMDEGSGDYNELIPEIGEALHNLRKAQLDSDELEKYLLTLTGQWNKIKERFH